MTEQEKRDKLGELTKECSEIYECYECPISFGTRWCEKYTEYTLPVGMLDDCLEEAIKAFGGNDEPDMVNHPSHYNREGAMETIDEMVLVYGAKNTIVFCMLNSHKYRARALYKNGEEDIKKSDFYYKKASELMQCYGIKNWME